MRTVVYFLTIFSILFISFADIMAGQNAATGIRFDLNSTTTGNQNVSSIACPGTDTFIRVDVYVTGASNMDTYEFDINYNAVHLQFVGGAEDQPITFEVNFLKKEGGSTTGFSCTASSGIVNCANTLIGDQGESTPDGEGLLASIVFKCLVDCPSALSFGAVDWYDNNGVNDVCTDKGTDAGLPVELSSFLVEIENGMVVLKWTTESEINTLGYNIYRGLPEDENFEKVNNEMIKALGTTTTKQLYTYEDTRIEADQTYFYKLEMVDTDGAREMSESLLIKVGEKDLLPSDFTLYNNYPNPFNPITTIKFDLPETSELELSVFNIKGQLIENLVSGTKQPGKYTVEWNAMNYPSGVYFYKMQAGDFVDVKKLVLMK